MDVEKFKGSYMVIELVRNKLERMLEVFGCVSVADYYEIIGHAATYADNKYGWVSLDKVKIMQTTEYNVYELILPKPMRLE